MTRKAKHPVMMRYKVVDTARGMAIFGMVIGHMLNWWLTEQDFWFYTFFGIWVFSFGAVSFIFISGASATLSLKRRTMELKPGDKFFHHLIRRIYFLRALLILVLALMYNIVVALWFQEPTWIWSWNILQTIAFSLFLVWPLIKRSKILRTIIGIVVLVVNEFILAFLLPYQGQFSVYGIIFYILYNPLDQYILLPFFTMFLFGTVLGDILHDKSQVENPEERKAIFKTHLIVTSIMGIILVIIGIFVLPDFERHASLASSTYSLGLVFVGYSIILSYEIFEPIKLKKDHRFFYYYNYYSFTIYVAHNPLYFIFYRQFTIFTIWIPIIITMTILSLIVIYVYRKLRAKASIKAALSGASFFLATNKETRKKLYALNRARTAARKRRESTD
jgi:uncharacterized membrane protein